MAKPVSEHGGERHSRVLMAALGVAFLTGWGQDVAWAQTGTIEGRVTDIQGGALVGATVAASAPEVPSVFAVTGPAGEFRLDALAPDVYTVTVTLSGFRSVQHEDVTLVQGGRTVLEVEMHLAPFGQSVDVVGVAPALGSGVSRDLIPGLVSVTTADEIAERGVASMADALNERFGAVSLESTTANLFQPTVRFRGFTASPLLGLPQGMAVYQNGVRVNEPFGDTVQFDLMPHFAVSQMQLSAGAEPTYGLNALGGALALHLKSGFDHTGFQGELSGGSFGRATGTAEWGANDGPWAIYVGATRFDEDGWRVASPSDVTQLVADLAYRRPRVEAGVTLTYADTNLNGNSAAPVELLEVDRSAVFTFPDHTDNRLAFTQGRFNVTVSPIWSVQLTGYYRDLARKTLNGDEANFSVCDDDMLPDAAPPNTLCLGSGDDENGSDDAGPAEPLVDARHPRRFITTADAEGDAAFNRTTTGSQGYGASLQTIAASDVAGRRNVLTLGASLDLADVDFSSTSEIGTLTRDRTVEGSGVLVGILGEAPDDRFNTSIRTRSHAVGLYFSDTVSLTSRAHLSASGRFNRAHIEIHDRLGTSLEGAHDFSRFNAGVGAVYQVAEGVSLFGRYTEANRAPTAAELSCADPEEPCRVPNAFVSDPPLEQAVARSVEGGVRGDGLLGGRGSVDWSLAVYRTGITDDILFVASPELIGTGFFRNAGDTRRVGLDAELTGQIGRARWYASYGLVQATFESPLELPGNAEANDAVTDDGVIVVQPGDRLTGIPRHSFKGGLHYSPFDAWGVAVELITASSRVLVGDEGNNQEPVPGYGVVSLRSQYRLTDNLELFVRVENLLGTEYATFGALAELEIFLEEAPDADDPRFYSPGAPRSGFAGLRVRF